MTELYATLIKAKKRTIAKVPTRYRDVVIALLAEWGLDENGDPALLDIDTADSDSSIDNSDAQA